VDPSYLARCGRSGVDSHKRLVLVDWLVEVVDEFQLRQETLYLAVSLLDRYLAVTHIRRGELQLIGITALWVAAKYEEVSPPALADYVDVTDFACSREQVLDTERRILRILKFELALPTSLNFLHQLLLSCGQEGSDEAGRASSACSCSSSRVGPGRSGSDQRPQGDDGRKSQPASNNSRRLVHLAEYLLELMLLTPVALIWRPSVLAAAALQLAANRVHDTSVPCVELAHAVGDHAGDVKAAVNEMCYMVQWALSSVAAGAAPMVYRKYMQRRRSCAALLAG